MIAKTVFVVLVCMALAFSTAPNWVAYGIFVKYEVGSDTIGFTVLNRTTEEIEIEIKPASSKEFSWAHENVSATYGQFWFDSSLFTSASVGDKIGDFSVTEKGTQTFAGIEWDTITIVGTISGVKTTRVYDKQSGLLLKQSVDDPKAPLVTLQQYNIPSITAYVPPPPTSQPAGSAQNESGTGAQTAPNATGPSTNVSGTAPQETTAPTGGPAAPSGEQQPQEGGCGSAAILLALLGFAAFGKPGY